MNNFKKGFTLIELLVVVLMIGILAAVALPQYKRAVERSRYAETEELLQSLSNAQQSYYLVHNKYADDFSGLDIDFPDISGEKGTGQTLMTKHFEFLLSDVNGTNNLAKAKRKKGDNKDVYGVYKNLNTGQVFCEDFDTNDDIVCDTLGINGEAVTCDDKSISTEGAEGCPEEDENCCPEGLCVMKCLAEGFCMSFCP